MAVRAPHKATYTVTGMTCQHCVASVTEELGALPEVTGVDGRSRHPAWSRWPAIAN